MIILKDISMLIHEALTILNTCMKRSRRMPNTIITYMLFFNIACNGYKEEKVTQSPIVATESSQSKKAALNILCDLPDDIADDPTKIGSYVSKKSQTKRSRPWSTLLLIPLYCIRS